MSGQDVPYAVSGVCCTSEKAVLRKRLDADLGAGTYRFNPVTGELRVAESAVPGQVVEAVRRAGFLVRQKQSGKNWAWRTLSEVFSPPRKWQQSRP
jgi:hypothetical protein